jgi:hypothetical protein
LFAFANLPHLGDDEEVAKMGHPEWRIAEKGWEFDLRRFSYTLPPVPYTLPF